MYLSHVLSTIYENDTAAYWKITEMLSPDDEITGLSEQEGVIGAIYRKGLNRAYLFFCY